MSLRLAVMLFAGGLVPGHCVLLVWVETDRDLPHLGEAIHILGQALRIINGGGRSEVQAAHIQPVEANGPDLVQNGLALSATAHWLFDRHLITIDPDFRLVVAHNRIPSELNELLDPSLTRIHLPRDGRLRPSERFLSHHRERFATAA